MGDDLHTLSPTALSILNHPAAIAVNQDPKGRSVYLVHHEKDAAPDIFGLSSIQVWTGTLYGGDQIVFLLNAGGKDTKISASLEEIFTHDRPEGSAPQVKEEWETAEPEKLFKDAKVYNGTEHSYKEDLKNNDSRLLGKKIGEIAAGGSWAAKVNKHSAEMFRLRSVDSGGKREIHSKKEL
ncbi:uncharacterized protein RCO7_08840 [Rhynchosporium graminicola]|uniref:alpha-galactosidase n=1 Tax=Rhynchosporium graminicola TaxID=2792576 RepID=A0A1E1KD04_9HELO|nr:uncharacterized protein RCO7_08840 [Rhynchosporium commune]